MTDDLVWRLRNWLCPECIALHQEAADRIEALIGDVAHEKEYLAEAEDLISQHYERAIRAEKRIKELEADSVKWQSAYRTVIDLETRIKELEAALISADADIADRALIARYKELEEVLRELIAAALCGSMEQILQEAEVAERALEGK